MPLTKNFRDIIILDELGRIVYFTIDNLDFFELKPEELLGNKITMFYENLTEESSNMMHAIRTGESTLDYSEELLTQTGKIVRQISSVYPIGGDLRVGAIEFASYNERFDTVKPSDSNASETDRSDTLYRLDDLIGEHESIHILKHKIRKAAPVDAPVLVCGKTGTGKEMVAQSIHNCSHRKSGPFISVNCAALPESLLESLLFGTVKGSFTDAGDKKGIFEISNGGTLFLDEINAMPLSLQTKVLTAIEEKRIRRIGGTKTIYLDVRIIAACNVNADQLLREKQLRSDLYFRLSAIQLNLPELKDRGKDIEILANHLIKIFNKKFRRNLSPLSPDVMEIFMEYTWPGNVRELKNLMEGLFLSVAEEEIKPCDLPGFLRSSLPPMDLKPVEALGLHAFLENEEKSLLSAALDNAGGNHIKAAKSMGLSPQLTAYKLKKYFLL